MTQLVRAYGQILRFPKEMSDDAISKAILDNEPKLNPDYKPPASSNIKNLAKEYLGVDVDLVSKKILDSRKSIADRAEESAARGEDTAAPQVPGAPVRQSTYNSALLNDRFGIKPQDNLDQSGILGRISKTADEDIRGQGFQENLRGAITDAPPPIPSGFTGLAKNILTGTVQTGRMIGSTVDAFGNDLLGVEDYAKESGIAAELNTPIEQRKLSEQFKQINRDQGLLGKIGDTVSAARQNPMGMGQLVAEQLPNTGVLLGGSYAGFKAGALAGSVFGPVGATIGGALGLVGGMFLGNALVDVGGRSIEKASDEDGFTPQEREEAINEGLKASVVITGVDLATLKIGGMLARSIGRPAINAGARAETKVLIDSGVDATSLTAINTALKSSPELFKKTRMAGEAAAIQSLSAGRKAAILGSVATLETIGEGVGAYGGEQWATGKGDVVDATVEALSSATMSLAETAYNYHKVASGNDLSAKGIQKAASNINDHEIKSGIDAIRKSKSVDEAIQAANESTSRKTVTKDDVLRTIDPTLADIERLTGLKPSESIEQAINQAQQGLSSESISTQGQPSNVAPNVDVVAQKKPVSQNDINEYAQLINDVEARKNNSPDTWTESDEKMLSLAKEKLSSISQQQGKNSDAIGGALTPEYYQWNRNKEGGQEYGNQQIVQPLTGETFKRYIVDYLRSDFKSFNDYQAAFPNTYISLVSKDQGKTWSPNKVGTLDEVRPNPKTPSWVKRVASFDSQEALQQGSITDSEISNATQQQGNIYEEETNQAPSTKKSARVLGNSTEIVLPDGTTLPAQWEIVSADNIKAAIKEGVNQPRDRTRASSDIQIQEISNNLDYRRLSDSPVMDVGAPTISHDGVIVAGHGRFEAVSLAHDKGMASSYLSSLMSDAANKGIDPADIPGIKKQILVRRITQPYDTRKLAIDSNSGTSLQYSGMELAKIDAERMKGIEDLDITDTGDIALTGSNISKLKQSLGDYNNTELSSLVDKNGALSQDGMRRVRNSLLAKAYGDSDTLGRLVESTDNDARNVLGALTRSAGVVAKVRSDIKAGALPKELDITNSLLDAVETLSQIRSKGQPLEQYLAQDNLFGDDIDADSKEILKFLHDNIRSQKKLTAFIKNVYGQISSIDQSTEDIFGDNVIPSKQDVIQNAKQATTGQESEQQDIFAKQPSTTTEQAAKTKTSDAGGSKEAQQDTGLNSETNNVIFDRFAELGNKKVSAKESLDDAKKITGIYLDIELEYTKLPDKVPARYNIERRVIQVGYGVEFERSVGAQYLAEELFHAVDAVTRDKAISSSSKRIDIKNGDVYSEVKNHFDNNGKYRDFLDYPLGNNILLSEDVIKIELFARLGVLYQGELEKLKTVLPKTYEAYHGIFGVTKSGIGGEVSSTIWRAGADNKGLNGDASMEVVGQHKPDGEISKANGGLDKSWDSLDVRRLRERISILLKANPSGTKIKFSGEGSLETKPLFSRSPEERMKDRERSKQLESKLREQGYNFTIQAKDVRDFAAMDRGRQNEAVAAEQIAKNFGKRIVWIEAIGDFEINGVMIPSIKDTIFIDVTTDKYARAVMGHELSHHMERDNPSLYRDLVNSLENLIKNHDEYADKYGIEGEDRGYITKEIVGDIMGDNFTDQKFWNKVAEYNPSAFRKIADKIITWLKNLVVKAKSRGLGSEQWVTDAQEAQDIIAKAVAKYTNKKSSLEGLSNKAKFSKAEKDYRMEHKSPGREGNAPLSDLTGSGLIYPDDVYSNKAVQYYGTGDDKMDRQSFEKAKIFRGKPDAIVEIYRAVPKGAGGEINERDWVTINKNYAKKHGESYFDGNYDILSKKVRAGDIFTNGDSIHEWGYEPHADTKFSKAEQLIIEQQPLNFGRLNLDYGDIKQRPGTTNKQRSEGGNAYQALLERIADRAGAKILGLAIAKDFKEQGGTSLIGQQVRTPDDLATVAQILRDPRYETFRVIYVKDNKIIHHTGVTSRLPGMVNVASKMKGESKSDAVDRFIGAIAKQKEMSGADGYYLLHNHPSGASTPSQGDKNVTIDVANRVPGFIAHVVINSNEYSVIQANGDSRVFQKVLSGGYGDDYVIPHRMLQDVNINSPIMLARIGKMLQRKDGFFTLIGLSAQNNILSISEIPLSALGKNKTQLVALLRSFARNSGSTTMAAVVQAGDSMKFKEAVESGVLIDVVDTAGNSLRENESVKDPTDTLFRGKDRNKSSIRVEQDSIPETINIDGVDRATRNSEGKLIHPTEEGIRNFWEWFSESKVLDEQSKPLVVYHGTNTSFDTFLDEKKGASTGAKSAKLGFFFAANPSTSATYTNYYSKTDEAKELIFAPIDQELEAILRDRYNNKLSEYNLGVSKHVADFSNKYKGPRNKDGSIPKIALKEADEKYKLEVGLFDAASKLAEYYRSASKEQAGNIEHIRTSPFTGANIIPVYLRAVNPLIHDYHGKDYREVSYSEILKQAIDEGKDSSVLINTKDGDELDNIYIVFSPNQIKSAIGNTGAFSSKSDDIRFSKAEKLYSKLQQVMADAPDKIFSTGKQTALWLQANHGKLNVKKEELHWSGVLDWLNTKSKVSKNDVVGYLDGHGVKVEEVELGNQTGFEIVKNGPEDYDVVGDSGNVIEAGFLARSTAQEFIDSRKGDGTKFADIVPPGGKLGTYRELLLTLLSNEKPWIDKKVEASAAGREAMRLFQQFGQNDSRTQSAMDKEKRLWDEANSMRSSAIGFRSTHYDQPSIFAHLRVDEVERANGKQLLRVVEVQSDWGQKGRKAGFVGDKPAYEKLPDGYSVKSRKEDGDANITRYWVEDDAGNRVSSDSYNRDSAIVGVINDLNDRARGTTESPVPSAPFVQDTQAWLSLAIKKAIIYATQNDMDGIVFATGQQNADFYDLSKQVSKVVYQDDSQLIAFDLGNNIVLNEPNVAEDKLQDYIGKEVALKLIESKSSGGKKQVSGLDLKVGGEGMLKFYDEIIPQTASKVLKQISADTKVTTIDLAEIPENEKVSDRATWEKTLIGFEITPDMQTKVMQEGLPLFSKAEKQKEPLIPESKFRKFQRFWQDDFNRFVAMKEWLADRGINLSEQADVSRAEERYHSKVANQIEDFNDFVAKPLIEKIAKAGFSMSDVADYLEAQHAEEANSAIAKLHKDPSMTAYGITNDEAEDYLSKAPKELGALANEFRNITEQTKKLLLDNGLRSQEEVDVWEAAYKHYIPVKGSDKPTKGTGKGLAVNSKTKRRLGHGRRDEAVIENILLDHNRAIIEIEKNRIAKHLGMMAAEIAMPELMTIGQPVKRKVLKSTVAYEVKVKGVTRAVFDSKDGANVFKQMLPVTDKKIAPSEITINTTRDQRIISSASPMLAENEINMYIDGHAIRIQINDEIAARAYKHLGIEGYGHLVAAGRAINGYLSKAYTGYAPEWGISNIIRDFTAGIINLTGEEGIVMAAKAVKNYPGSFASLLGYAFTGRKKSNKWIDMYRANGGNTGAAWLPDMERLSNDVASEYAAFQGVVSNLKQGDMANASRAALRKLHNVFLKWLNNLNQASENAMRLAAFKAMIESGKSVNEASHISKNITINFNKKGEFGQTANAAYLFFNATMNGQAAMNHALFKGKHKYQAWALGGAGLTALGYTMAAMLGGGDEDEYDKLDDYTKERNMVIKSGDGWIKIPVPYGHGFFWSLGRSIADAQRKDELGALPWHIASSAIEELTPLGSIVVGSDEEFKSDQVFLGLLPTVAQIAAQPALNKSIFSGGEIMPESPFDQSQPARDKMWRGTKGTIYDKVAGWLEEAGVTDISPETLKHLTRSATGGAGSTMDAVISSVMLKSQGAELDANEMPFARKLYHENTIRSDRAAFQKASGEARTAAEEFHRARRDNDLVSIDRILKDKHEMLMLDNYANKLQKFINIERDEQDAVRTNESIPIAERRLKLKELEAKEAKFYNEYLDVFKIDKSVMKERMK